MAVTTIRVVAALLTAASCASPLGAFAAFAKVDQASDRGFVVRLSVDVAAEPDAVWRMLTAPREWWNAEQTYSGDAANLSLDARAGGCFCEVLPGAATDAPSRGSVEHMRVVYIERPRALRMVGALGPLQAEALTGTLTVQLTPAKAATGGPDTGGPDTGGAASGPVRTRVLWEYVVGGFMRPQPPAIAAATDTMLTRQLARLAEKLGGARPAAADVPPADPAPTTRDAEPPATPEPQAPNPMVGR